MYKRQGLSLGGYLQMLAWFVLLCGLVSRLRYKQEALLLLATPLALILFAVSAPYLSAVVQVPPQLKGSFYALHVGALFLSMGLMTLAFAASSLFLFLERRIKSKQRMEDVYKRQASHSVRAVTRHDPVEISAALPRSTPASAHLSRPSSAAKAEPKWRSRRQHERAPRPRQWRRARPAQYSRRARSSISPQRTDRGASVSVMAARVLFCG